MRKLLLLLPSIVAFAQPNLSSVIEGEATFRIAPQTLEIIASDRAILEWNDFNIEVGELTQFIQPHSNAVVLNRVLDANPSRLMGKLGANGSVLLINPNGILIGREAIINTGAFLATTLDLQNQCFLANKELKFEGKTRAIIENWGEITARFGPVELLGWEVANHGSIRANSHVALIGGSEIATQIDSTSLFHFRTVKDGESFSLSVNGGSIHAQDTYLFGERIWLKNGSLIDVSGDDRAGTVLIGGDYQGENSSYQNAKYVVCEAGAKILADSYLNGNGGKIILWSDLSNVCFGNLSAKGGTRQGNGGLIEVSAPMLVYDGIAELNSFNGKQGLLYLDPTDVTIGAATCATAVIGCPTAWTVACGCPVNIAAAAIAAALAGGDVCINTADAPDLGCAGLGDIRVNTGFTWASANDLFLTATSDIIVAAGANITPTGAGNVTLSAGGNISINANIQNTGIAGMAGNVILIAPTGSTITISDAGGANPRSIGVGSQNGTTSVGDLNLARCNRSRPNVVIQAANHISGCTLGFIFPFNSVGAVATGPIDVVCNNLNVRGLGGVGFASASVGHATQGGPPSSTNPITTATATISVDATGTITLDAGAGANDSYIGHGGRFTTGALAFFAGNICVNAVGAITIQKTPTTGIGSAGIGHGSISLSTGGASVNADVTVQSAANITLSNNSTDAGLSFSGCFIGHGSGHGLTETRSGNIYVLSAGNLTLNSAFNSSLTATNSVFIGHSAFDSYNIMRTLTNSNSNIYVSVNGNLTINANSSGTNGIGTIVQTTLTGGVLEMLVGGDLTVTSGSGRGISPVHLGQIVIAGIQPTTANTNIAVGGNITLTPNAIGQSICITAPANINVSARGNIVGTGSGVAVPAVLGGQSNIAPAATTINSTRIRAGGSILANFGALGTPFLMGITTAPPTIPPLFTTGSLIIQASDQLSILNGFRTTSGDINLATGIPFGAGDLWTVAANQLTTVAGQAVAALPFSGCVLCNPFLNTALTDSLDIQAGCICATFNTGVANANLFQTNSGDLNFEADSCTFCCLTPSAVIGTAVGDTLNLQQNTGNVTITMFQNLTINAPLTGNNFLLIACNNIDFTAGGSIDALGNIDLVVDNAFPNSPFLGTGAFTMDAGSFINSNGYLRIYTSQQEFNSILGTLNGLPFILGTLFENTNQEQWCTYYPAPIGGVPFTIFYKNCLQQLIEQSMVIVTQFQVDLHPYNEFPGWESRFLVRYPQLDERMYFLRRRNLNILNHPKSWTVLLPEDTRSEGTQEPIGVK